MIRLLLCHTPVWGLLLCIIIFAAARYNRVVAGSTTPVNRHAEVTALATIAFALMILPAGALSHATYTVIAQFHGLGLMILLTAAVTFWIAAVWLERHSTVMPRSARIVVTLMIFLLTFLEIVAPLAACRLAT